MNRAKLVVVTTLWILVVGMAGILYNNYNPPVFAVSVLGLLALLLLAAVLSRPVGTTPPPKQISSSRWMRDWVLANGLAWLTAASVLLFPLYRLASLPTYQLARSFMLWMALAGVAVSAIWAAGQWIGLAAVVPHAGRWLAYTFIGTLSVYACLYIFGALALNIIPAANVWVENNVPTVAWYFAWLLIPFVLGILGALYSTPFILTGYLTGRLQTGLLAAIAPSIEKWAQDNALNMAAGSLLGPLGGIVYALLSGRILRPKLFGEEDGD